MKRQPNRENNHHDRSWKNHRRPIRLLLEPLEARRLLAGLNVSVLIDQDGSRSADAVDTAATRRVVFLDLNNNGQQDSTDPVAFTNERGIASFESIAAGNYAVGIAAGNSLQSQSFPVRVDELGTNLGPAAKSLVANDDLSKVWAFDADGQGQLLSSGFASTATVPAVDVGGEIATSVTMGASAWIVSRSNDASNVTNLIQFNLSSGELTSTEVRGLNGRVIEKLVKTGNDVVAQLSGPRGIELAKLSLVDGVPTIGLSASFPNLVTVSGGANQLVVVEYRSDFGFANSTIQMSPLATKLSSLSVRDFSTKATTVLPQAANEVSVSADGRFVFAAFSVGGVMVLNNDANLSAAATLAEASGPLLTQSKDGRFVTGNSTNAFEFIVWNSSSWQPSGRTQVTASTQSSLTTADAISHVVLANNGDRLIATGMVGTVASQLAQATTAPVTVPVDGIGSVQLGVRVNGEGKAPVASPIALTFLEDNSTSGQFRSQVVDAENDTLWFAVTNAPAHGRLRVTPSGEWAYQPADNFNGTDRAIVRVFDGQSSSDLALVLNVTPVNDLPEELRVEVHTIPENFNVSDATTELGYATVFDVDRGSRYRFETTDERFQVRNGRIFLTPGAKLDFETEPTIELGIVATEDAESGYQISTTATLSIADVNEAPSGVRILNAAVPENAEGATVGQIQVDDPDHTNRFEYVVTDSRFEIEGGFLKLKPGVELDFEQANSISMSITVSDSSGQSYTQPFTLTVADQNDAPTAIDVNVRPIEEATPGAVIGTIAVNDEDGQAYEYTVSDARFEVVDGELKLKEGQTVDKAADAGLLLTVVATSLLGNDTIASTIGVPVVAKRSPYQNPVEPRDVNGDGQVTPLDALILLNYINSFGPGPVGGNAPRGGSGEAPAWVDVNGDGVVSPIDILLIINWLNRQRLIAESTETVEGEGEGEGIASPNPASPVLPSPLPMSPVVVNFGSNIASQDVIASGFAANLTDGSNRFDVTSVTQSSEEADLVCHPVEAPNDAAIDQELESLLDQLSRERLGFFNT